MRSRKVQDPRSPIHWQHPLVSVVVIARLAVLAGAGGPTAVAPGALLRPEFLWPMLDLPEGIPRQDDFRRVLMALKPAAFQVGFAGWLQSLRPAAAAGTGGGRPVLPVDGKTARRSHDRPKGLGALHLVSAWASESGRPLGQVACDERSNEITALPELLRLVAITGAIITRDAMGPQEAIAAQVIAGKADSVLALKGDQETRHQAVIEGIDDPRAGDLAGAQERVTTEEGHGREETRTYLPRPAPAKRPGSRQWRGRKSIGPVTSHGLREGKETVEVRSSLSRLEGDVKQCARAVRGHWSLENSWHWGLDLTIREDESRLRERHLREDVAWLNRVAWSLLKQHPSRQSVVMRRRSCGWSDAFLREVVTGSTC